MNPLSADLGVMRQTLLFGGLESIMRNSNRKAQNLRFFEFGNIYHFKANQQTQEQPIKGYVQEEHLALWLTGKRMENSWIGADIDSSFYELKAYVENIFRRVGLSTNTLVLAKSKNNIFSNALMYTNHHGKVIAELGILTSQIRKNFGIEKEIFYADIYWNQLMQDTIKKQLTFSELSKYPAVSRDLALLVDKKVEFAEIEEIARQTEKKILKKVELFDVYEGKNLPVGKKSYAVNFILQDDSKTLTDKAIDTIMKKLIHQLTTRLKAELR